MGTMLPASSIFNPRVSVIVTAHDRLSYLARALSSVAGQSLSPTEFEVIVVTNLDVDQIRPIVADPRVQIITEVSASLGQKIATAFRHTRGEVICLLEDDDAFTPDKLSTVLAEFAHDAQLGYFHNHYSLMGPDDRSFPPSRFRARTDRLLHARGQVRIQPETRWNAVHQLRGIYPEFNNSCISVRREMLERSIHLLPIADLATDQFLLLLALRSPWTIVLDPRRLTKVRLHVANTSHISQESRVVAPHGLLEVSQRNAHAIEALGEPLKEGQPHDYCQIVDSVIAVERTLLDLRGAEIRRARYREAFRQLFRFRSSYVIQTRYPLLIMVGMAIFSPAVALSLYRTVAGQIS